MTYANDPENIRQQAAAIQKVNEAFLQSNGLLRLTLTDARTVQGRYFGVQCSTALKSMVKCSVTIAQEEAEYPEVYDVLEIVDVQPAGD